ncbi:BREX-3 system phosphatase PglZ, partial [Pseudomonas aeruginosa]
LWIVADPDNVLLDEQVLAGLRERGFDVLPVEDSIAFRAEYEERYRPSWAAEEPHAPKALVIQVRDSSIADLPWDYLRQGRKVSLSLAELFPKLSYTVLRQLGSEILPSLFEAQTRHATQAMGEAATKEFVLTHIYRVSPHLITRPEDLWRELLRLHYRETLLPRALAEHIHQVLADRPVFASCPVAELFSNRSFALRVVQDAWYRYLSKLGLTGLRTAEPEAPDYIPQLDITFEHHDIRVIVDSMFLDGTLHPLAIQGVPVSLPEWAKAGVVQDPAAMRNLVLEGIKNLGEELPGVTSPYRDWTHFARRLGEVISRFHSLDTARADSLKTDRQD